MSVVNFKAVPYQELKNEMSRPNVIPGDVDFKVVKAELGMSKTNNQMIKLELDIVDAAGNKGKFWDNLVFPGESSLPSSRNFSLMRLRNFCVAVGHEEWYEQNGAINLAACVDLKGTCKLAFERNKETGLDVLKVKNYLEPKASAGSSLANDFVDSDMPF
jgi:hypothetical protein